MEKPGNRFAVAGPYAEQCSWTLFRVRFLQGGAGSKAAQAATEAGGVRVKTAEAMVCERFAPGLAIAIIEGLGTHQIFSCGSVLMRA
jgi:hypothetical protein